MAIREVIQIGHPALKKNNTKITDFNDLHVANLIQDLEDTMIKAGLIGLASPQIGENYTIFVTQPRKTESRVGSSDEFRAYINPKIINTSKEESIMYEGCGSVANGQLFGPVKRPKEITIQAFDPSGKKFQLRCDGILARVIQHEYDHLFGIEFMEKVSDYKNLLSLEYYQKTARNSEDQIKAGEVTVLEFEYVS